MIKTIEELKKYLLEKFGKYNMVIDDQTAKTVIINHKRFNLPINEEDLKKLYRKEIKEKEEKKEIL